jgi:dTDP-4-dehydrorhamnose reductase
MAKTKIIILGASGMLGSMVLDVFSREKDFAVSVTFRNLKEGKEIQKKYPKIKIKLLDVEVASEKDIQKILGGNSWAINCIGLIKPYIHDDNARECERAIRINALYPQLLASAAQKTNTRVLQIETDCVYSGKKGNYLETDEHDALDVYGKTKSLGEVNSPNVFHLRDSIIGPEQKAHLSLMDWFLMQPKNAKVNGFSNHKWNGVTTYHFAKICIGIIKKNLKLVGMQHVTAADKPSKAEMLKLFAKYFSRNDISITPVKAPKVINRTLETNNKAQNQKIWASAGYPKPLKVSEMIKELAQYLEREK